MKITCCNKCADRHSGCHAECEEYKRQKDLYNEAKKEKDAFIMKQKLPEKVLYRYKARKRGQ